MNGDTDTLAPISSHLDSYVYVETHCKVQILSYGWMCRDEEQLGNILLFVTPCRDCDNYHIDYVNIENRIVSYNLPVGMSYHKIVCC